MNEFAIDELRLTIVTPGLTVGKTRIRRRSAGRPGSCSGRRGNLHQTRREVK